jgi:hypothetical protein
MVKLPTLDDYDGNLEDDDPADRSLPRTTGKAKFFPVRDVPVSEMTDQEIEELRDTL